jgi:hypothetical protein
MGAAADFVRSALDYLLGGPAVGGPDEDRLRRWLALPGPDLVVPHARARYVVVASVAERRHRPVAIAAVTVERMQLDFSGCFGTTLRASPGGDAKAAMLAFLEFTQAAPLVAFDAGSERVRVERATKSLLGVPLRRPWIDLGVVLRALARDAPCASLDECTRHFGVAHAVREAPLGDALAAAQLLLIALDAAARAGAANARALLDLR